jgi:5-methylcytosine-specific restriction protein A
VARVKKIVFRKVTPSDFYWINQSGSGTGGRQSYFDFNTSDVTAAQWENFFKGTPAVRGVATNGPYWTFDVRSLGTGVKQTGIKLGQRRTTSFSIRSQKLPEHSDKGNRLYAWRPSNGFPALPSHVTSADHVPASLIAGLRIFLIVDDSGEFWAGWVRSQPSGLSDPQLKRVFQEDSAMIVLSGQHELDPSNIQWPFKAPVPPSSSAATTGSASPTASGPQKSSQAHPQPTATTGKAGPSPETSESTEGPVEPSPAMSWEDWDPDDELSEPIGAVSYKLQQVRTRNRKAVKALKKLYGLCQMTGSEFLFSTSKGEIYLEVHHLVPLGSGGADSPYNMVVLSPLAHRMLHYAKVEGLDLSKIEDNKLKFLVNDKPAVIEWHPKHFALVQSQTAASES